jgi:hypothetical protein
METTGGYKTAVSKRGQGYEQTKNNLPLGVNAKLIFFAQRFKSSPPSTQITLLENQT